MLRGRQREMEAVERVLDGAVAGRGGAVVLDGPAGIGKTALLDATVGAAMVRGLTCIHVTGSEAEQAMALAGVTQLCLPLRSAIERLAPRQAHILRSALGEEVPLDTDEPSQLMALGLAVLSLLTDAADQALAIVIDDAHWLDPSSQQVLGFVARRLEGAPVAMVVARRPGVDHLGIRHRLELGELDQQAAVELLAERGLVRHVGAAISSHSGGVPLLLHRIAERLTPSQRDGLAPLPDPLPTGTELEADFGTLAASLGVAECSALLRLAAAGDHLDVVGLDPSLTPALRIGEQAGLVRATPAGYRFVHPLARSGVYWGASPVDRRDAHRHLAEALPSGDPARVWHRAECTVGPDDDLACDLVELGHDIRRRGGAASAVVAFQRAAEFAADRDLQVEAILAGATAALEAGALRSAELLVTQAEDRGAPLGSLLALRADLAERRGALGDSRALRGRLGEVLRSSSPRRADAAAVSAASVSVRLYEMELARHWLSAVALEPDDQVTGRARLLGSILRARDVGSTTAQELPEMIRRLRAAVTTRDDLCFLADAAGFALGWIGRSDELSALTDELHREAAEVAPEVVPALLVARAVYLGRSDLAGAESAAEQAAVLAAELGRGDLVLIASSWMAVSRAGRGDPSYVEPVATVDRSDTDAAKVAAAMARGYYHLAVEEWAGALEALEPLHTWSGGRPRTAMNWQADLAEAAVKTGRIELAEAQREILGELAATTGSAWLRASHDRVRAQLTDDLDAADAWFSESVATFVAADYRIAGARAALMWGERLRRGRRRAASRERLLAARDGFAAAGMARWVERCDRELAAAGAAGAAGTGGPGGSVAAGLLTPTELQVARWIVAGESQRDVATRLFLSPRTIETHLTAIYRKLGVRGRAELAARATSDPSLLSDWSGPGAQVV